MAAAGETRKFHGRPHERPHAPPQLPNHVPSPHVTDLPEEDDE